MNIPQELKMQAAAAENAASETRVLAEKAAVALREAADLLRRSVRYIGAGDGPGFPSDVAAWLRANDQGGE